MRTNSTAWKKGLKKKRYSLAALGILFILSLVLFLPSTSLYKSAVRSLWLSNHPAVVYYLNYRDPALAMEEGNYYFGGGAYDVGKAINAYERAIALQPGTYLARYQLGRIYFVEGNLPKAAGYMDDELQLDPSNLRPLYERGLIEDAQNNLPAAEADFTQFVAWAPTEWGGYNDLAFTLAKEWKFAQSEAVIREALKNVPDASSNPWLLNSLGLAQLNQLDYKDAEDSFAKALPLAQQITTSQWERAYSANDPAGAGVSIAVFQQSIESNLSDAKTGATMGE